MAISTIKAVFPRSAQEVWAVVTSLENFGWRSDLSKIEVLSDTQFVEYTKDGYPTKFTITDCEPPLRWGFDMENSNICGHWVGYFSDQNGQTEITFTESVTAKKLLMKPFVKAFLKKQQALYVSDLEKALRQ